MTIEATLDRIAAALEKIAAGGTALSTGTVASAPTKPAASKTSSTAAPKATASTAAPSADTSSIAQPEAAVEIADTSTADLADPKVVEELRKASGAAILAACKPGAIGKPLVLKLLAEYGASGNATIPVDKIEEFTARLSPDNAATLKTELGE